MTMNSNSFNLMLNRILMTDSYKLSHPEQYPDKTETVFSYIEARGVASPELGDETLVVGPQVFVQDFLGRPFTMDEVNQASMFAAAHGEPFNYDGWKYIVEKCNGILPVRIKSVREGTVVKLHNVLVTIENTDPNVPWITSFLETVLLRAVWYPTTIASVSYAAKKIIYSYLLKTADDPEKEIWFKLQDFGARGVSSRESAGLGALAHLVNFMGSDTMSGIVFAQHYYNTTNMVGFSIPAAEHSTMTINGEAGEFGQFERMIEKYAAPGKMFAVVSDSYDIYRAVEQYWCKRGLLKRVKDAGATVVIRPDSGDPTKVAIELIEIIMRNEGYGMNSKGYRVLPDHVRIIQGDGMNLKTIKQLYENLEAAGLSASNVTVGMGGGLLQKYDRDSYKWAMKASAACIDGKWVDVYKDPITDKGKRSKKGRITLVLEDNGNNVELVTKRISEVKRSDVEVLRTIYDNGIVQDAMDTFETLRERAHKFLVTGVHVAPLKKAA